jgi:hypothetical protein
MRNLFTTLASLAAVAPLLAAPPSFRTASVPEGWVVVKGEAEPGVVRSARPTVGLELKTSAPQALPVEATFSFRAAQGDAVTFQVLEEAKGAKPLLQSAFRMTGPTLASITAQASGEPMGTTAPSIRGSQGNRRRLRQAGSVRGKDLHPALRVDGDGPANLAG